MCGQADRNVRLLIFFYQRLSERYAMITALTVTKKEQSGLSRRDLPAGEMEGKNTLFTRTSELAAVQR